MTRISDKALRELLRDATSSAGRYVPRYEGQGVDACVHRFIALAPDLATEVLALRKEMRRLKRENERLAQAEREASARADGRVVAISEKGGGDGCVWRTGERR